MGSPDIDTWLYQLELPLRRRFVTASGAVSTRTVGLVATTQNGFTGWGEAAPFPGQDEPFGAVVEAARTGGMTPTLAAAIDEAVCDLVARARDEKLIDELGPARSRVPISVAVGMGDDVLDQVEAAANAGIESVKVKIAPGRIDHVKEIRDRFAYLTVGVDANGSFDTSSLGELLTLSHLGIAYLEQPFPTLDRPEVSMLSEAGLAVFADESVRTVGDGVTILALPGVTGIVVKPGRLGWQASVVLVRLARTAGKQWRASGLLESGIGRIYTDLLASAPDAYLSDAAPADWFITSDVVASRAEGGEVIIPGGLGSGLEIDRDAIEDMAVAVIPISGSAVPDPC